MSRASIKSKLDTLRSRKSKGPAHDRSNSNSPSPNPAMPPPRELEAQFDAFLTQLSMPPQTKDAMRAMPDANKWLLICQKKSKRTDDENAPMVWVDKLQDTNNVTADTLRKLRVILGSEGVTWMEAFMKQRGMVSLIKCNPNNDKNLTLETLRCIKAFLGSDFGLGMILETPDIMSDIVSMFSARDELSCKQILDILTVVCWVSEEGHQATYEAMIHYQKRNEMKTPFSILMKMIRKTTSHELQLSLTTSLNVMINSFHLLEERTYYRSFLIDDNIQQIIDNLRLNPDEYGLLATQLEVFVDEWKLDEQERVFKRLDMSDPDAIFAFIMNSC
eukprot:268119_1